MNGIGIHHALVKAPQQHLVVRVRLDPRRCFFSKLPLNLERSFNQRLVLEVSVWHGVSLSGEWEPAPGEVVTHRDTNQEQEPQKSAENNQPRELRTVSGMHEVQNHQ